MNCVQADKIHVHGAKPRAKHIKGISPDCLNCQSKFVSYQAHSLLYCLQAWPLPFSYICLLPLIGLRDMSITPKSYDTPTSHLTYSRLINPFDRKTLTSAVVLVTSKQ